MSNRKSQNDLNEKIDMINNNINELKELVKNGKATEVDKKNLINYEDLHRQFKRMLDACEKYTLPEGKSMTNQEKVSNFDSYNKEFSDAFEKAKNVCDNIQKDLSKNNDSINKLSDDNYITQLIKDFNNYLSNLSMTEICLVINISSSLFILSCLVTILFSVYGNFIINKLSLEEKYPKIAIFIKLRVKLQHSYILINTLLIFIVLILMIIINFITLTNGG